MSPREAIERSFTGWEKVDPKSVAELFAPDGRYEDPLFPEALVGPEAIEAGIRPGMEEITDLTIRIKHLTQSADVGIVEAEFRSKMAGSDARLDFDFAMVVTMRDGLITRLTEYFDTRGWA